MTSFDRAFWHGKRVFITGHTGFKGSWISLWLQSLGAIVTGYALKPPTNPNLFEVAHVARGMTSLQGDIRDLDCLRLSMQRAAPEIVIHMAAQPLVRQSYQDPLETYSTNVIGLVNLLETIRFTSGVKVVLNVTSDKCYENREWVWGYREDDPVGGYDPYSSSKGCAELVTAAYRSSFFNPRDYALHGVAVATARAGNVIGGGDWAQDRLVPDIVAAFQRCESVEIRNSNAIRPWQHVLEPVRGYLMLTELLYRRGPRYAEAWNFGPTDEDAKPVSWIVSELATRWGGSASWHSSPSVHPHEAQNLKLDTSKVRSLLGWTTNIGISEALDLVVEWAKAYASKQDMHSFTLSQIDRYQKSILS